MLETCSTIIRGAITRVRRAKQELRKVEVAVNIDTNCGNLNMHCTWTGGRQADSNHCWAGHKTGNRERNHAGNRSGEVLCRKCSDKNWQGLLKSVGHRDPTWIETELKVLEPTVETAIKSPEDGGADIEGTGNRPIDKLVNVNSGEVTLKDFKNHKQTGQHLCNGQQCKVTTKGLQDFQKNTLQRLQENTKELRLSITRKKHWKKTLKKTLRNSTTEQDALNTKHSKSSKPMSTCKGMCHISWNNKPLISVP